MAIVKLEHPVREMHGALEKHGIITRQKKFRDDKGRVIFEGRQEAYAVRSPRDWKKTPAQGAELVHHNRWREACLRTTQILRAAQPEWFTQHDIYNMQIDNTPLYYTPEEAKALYDHYRQRFLAQLPNSTYHPAPDPSDPSSHEPARHTKPDPQAPIDPVTRSPKRYAHFPGFIRAMLYLSLKSAQ